MAGICSALTWRKTQCRFTAKDGTPFCGNHKLQQTYGVNEDPDVAALLPPANGGQDVAVPPPPVPPPQVRRDARALV